MKRLKPDDETFKSLSSALGLSDDDSAAFRLMRETLEADLLEEYDDTDSQVLRRTDVRVVNCTRMQTAAKPLISESVLTCPICAHQRREIMPTDACQYFYECAHCKSLLKPKAGDCCVFCSYGTVACPPIQQQRNCCQS